MSRLADEVVGLTRQTTCAQRHASRSLTKNFALATITAMFVEKEAIHSACEYMLRKAGNM